MYLYVRDKVMVSNLESLSAALTRQGKCQNGEARCLAERIKSDEKIQADLQKNGLAYFRDEAGRDFVVRRKAAAAGQ